MRTTKVKSLAQNNKKHLHPRVASSDQQTGNIESFKREYFWVHQAFRRNVRISGQIRSHVQREMSRERKFLNSRACKKVYRKVYDFQWEKQDGEEVESFRARLSPVSRSPIGGSRIEAHIGRRKTKLPRSYEASSRRGTSSISPGSKPRAKRPERTGAPEQIHSPRNRPLSPITFHGHGLDPFNSLPSGGSSSRLDQMLANHCKRPRTT
jgi:hypothetical protein